MINRISVAVVVAVILIGWTYMAIKPPPPKICGSINGPPVTSPRVKLSDGRHLAYREFGFPKEEARYKIIVVHGYGGSKDIHLPVSQELIDDLRIYFLHFDRAGYGESDPYPSRSVKSEAYDIQELADNLQIGERFYITGMSMGAYSVWSCLKYIPHSSDDVEILKSLSETPNTGQEKITQQGEYESLHRDIMAGFGKWEFGPTEIKNPFPNNDGSVHIWQGFEDKIIPYTVNRYISQKLPWIHYHEVPEGGHLFIFKNKQSILVPEEKN
ncbi:hypothetical protein TSUD_103650 [Trifolium subterraneum]|uniref:AB hydrolase-1 domain-containing protein n=1 Tax=Trifolium subterraneum TaxID=3900 RepID=A0A2Z6N8F7_TRISU|nr:hypothetical protein TSUD_103650 [Trifolium subterraneum]